MVKRKEEKTWQSKENWSIRRFVCRQGLVNQSLAQIDAKKLFFVLEE